MTAAGTRHPPDGWTGGPGPHPRPPWDENSGTRIWPNVIPLPEGCPARYIALMMDRLNFPGMSGSWTYGAMYLYHAHPVNDLLNPPQK